MLQPRKTKKKKLTPQEELKMKNNQQGFSPWGYTPIQTERQDVLKPTEKSQSYTERWLLWTRK